MQAALDGGVCPEELAEGEQPLEEAPAIDQARGLAALPESEL